MIDWSKLSAADKTIAGKIADRAMFISDDLDPLAVQMDICAAHLHMPLDLFMLLHADKSTFMHDIFGISAYLDRETGEITDHFLPKCTKPTTPLHNKGE